MENILKKSSGRAERFVLAYAIVVVMVFGVLNPLTYVTDFNTAQESVEWESREYGYKALTIWKCVFK